MSTPGYQPPMPHYTATPAPKVEAACLTAFIVSIISLMFVMLPVPAILALFLASAGKRNVTSSNGARRGTGLATAARVIALVSLLVTVLIYTLPTVL